MKNLVNLKKVAYFISCFVILIFVSGCRGKELKISVFDGLPESKYLSEVKTALENKTPMAVSFTAEWCPHCRKYKPTFFEVKDELKDKALFLNIDVEDTEGSTITNRFQVRGIPTTAFVRADGSVLKVHVGAIEKNELTNIINELISSKKRKRGEPVAPFPIEPVEEVKKPSKDTGPQELIEEKPAEEQESIKKQEPIEQQIPVDINATPTPSADQPKDDNQPIVNPESSESKETDLEIIEQDKDN